MAPAKDRFVILGQFAGPHGVRGEFKLRSFTEDPRDLLAYGTLRTEAGRVLRASLLRELKPGLFLARAPEIDSPEACEAYRGASLGVDRSALPAEPAEEDEYYLTDLVGLVAETEDGSAAGRVKAVQNFGADDLVELEGVPDRKGTVFVTFSQEDVPVVDIPGGRLVVVLPPEADEVPGPEGDQPDANPERGRD